MKKILLLTAFAGLLLTSCQKSQDDQLFSQTVTIAADSASKVSGWQALGLQTGSGDSRGNKTAAAGITESAVTEAILSDGAVLVFGRREGKTFLLPTTETGVSYSYEASANSIDVQVSSREAVPETLEVLYIVLSSTQIGNAEKTGVSRDDLMNLSYEKAQILFSLP